MQLDVCQWKVHAARALWHRRNILCHLKQPKPSSENEIRSGEEGTATNDNRNRGGSPFSFLEGLQRGEVVERRVGILWGGVVVLHTYHRRVDRGQVVSDDHQVIVTVKAKCCKVGLAHPPGVSVSSDRLRIAVRYCSAPRSLHICGTDLTLFSPLFSRTRDHGTFPPII